MTVDLATLREFGALAGVPEPDEFAATSAAALAAGRVEILDRAVNFAPHAADM